jgi:hypothetical protein
MANSDELFDLVLKYQSPKDCTKQELFRLAKLCNELWHAANSKQGASLEAPEQQVITPFLPRIINTTRWVMSKSELDETPLPVEYSRVSMKTLFQKLNISKFTDVKASWLAAGIELWKTCMITDYTVLTERADEFPTRSRHIIDCFLRKEHRAIDGFSKNIYVGNRMAYSDFIEALNGYHIPNFDTEEELFELVAKDKLVYAAFRHALHTRCMDKNYDPSMRMAQPLSSTYAAKEFCKDAGVSPDWFGDFMVEKPAQLYNRVLKKGRGQYGGFICQRLFQGIEWLYRHSLMDCPVLERKSVEDGTNTIPIIDRSVDVELLQQDPEDIDTNRDDETRKSYTQMDESTNTNLWNKRGKTKTMAEVSRDIHGDFNFLGDGKDADRDWDTRSVPNRVVESAYAELTETERDKTLPDMFIKTCLRELQAMLQLERTGKNMKVECQLLQSIIRPVRLDMGPNKIDPHFMTASAMVTAYGCGMPTVERKWQQIRGIILQEAEKHRGMAIQNKIKLLDEELWPGIAKALEENKWI